MRQGAKEDITWLLTVYALKSDKLRCVDEASLEDNSYYISSPFERNFAIPHHYIYVLFYESHISQGITNHSANVSNLIHIIYTVY